MRGGGRLFVVAGVGLGLVAVLLAVLAFTGGDNTDAKKQEAKDVTVVEALMDVQAHTLLTTEHLTVVKVPESEVTPDALRDTSLALGQAYRVDLLKGQRLSMSQLEQPGLRNQITPGLRAMAVPLSAVNQLGGMIQEGDHVDVVFHARLNEVRLLSHTMAMTPEDEEFYKFESSDGFGWTPRDYADEFPMYPAAGDPGSQMYIRDDISEEQQLEPVAKTMVQDVRVLRVVRPGEQYSGNGQRVEAPVADGPAAAGSTEEPMGYLIVEVNGQQAEVLTFIQDRRHTYNVVVRGIDDHDLISTSGVSFAILATNADYALPLPRSVTVPAQE